MDIVKMSDKGQLVVPQALREQLGLAPGDRFVALPTGKGIAFERVELEDAKRAFVESYRKVAVKMRERVKSGEITRSDVDEAIRWAREQRRKERSSSTRISSSQR